MIMVNVKSVIFFGKCEKNIWVLDFFNYNSQSKQQTRYNRKTLGTVSQSKHGTAEQIQQLSQLLQQ